MASSSTPKEDATPGLWCFKKTDEDGVVLRINDARAKSKADHVMLEVTDVKRSKAKAGCKRKVEVTCTNPRAQGGLTTLVLDTDSFRSDGCEQLVSYKDSSDFAEKAKRLLKETSELEGGPDYSAPFTCSSPTISSEDEEPRTAKKSKKARKKLSLDPKDLSDIRSPPKRKARTSSEETFSCRLGRFQIPVETLLDSPARWHDRQLDQTYVERLVSILEEDSVAMIESQPWLAIATDIAKPQFTDKTMLKGCSVKVIGGRHRFHAFKQMLHKTTDESTKRVLSKVWVSVYDNTLDDKEIRKLAAHHNYDNVGSRATKWIERVKTCREWLYKQAGKDIALHQTPKGTTEWKTACAYMYTPKGKDANTLEPTLQAALLRKDVWELFEQVGEMYSKGQLKGMENNTGKKKRCRRKTERDLKQHQIGMPLQGLNDESKKDLLSEVVSREITLDELALKAKNIKAKKSVLLAFMNYVQEESEDRLRRRFPLHTTEERLNQFKHLKLKKKDPIPADLESFFKRAMAWESKTSTAPQADKEGVYSFAHMGNVGLVVEGGLDCLTLATEYGPFSGFNLVLLKIEEDCDVESFKLFLIRLHSFNLGKVSSYWTIIFPNQEQHQFCEDKLKEKQMETQKAFWVDTKPRPATGKLLPNSVHPFIIGHWCGGSSSTNKAQPLNYDGGNVFMASGNEESCLPVALLAQLVNCFCGKDAWVLDLSNTKGNGMLGSIQHQCNCMVLCEKEAIRETTHNISKVMSTFDGEK